MIVTPILGVVGHPNARSWHNLYHMQTDDDSSLNRSGIIAGASKFKVAI